VKCPDCGGRLKVWYTYVGKVLTAQGDVCNGCKKHTWRSDAKAIPSGPPVTGAIAGGNWSRNLR
jgi:hypothetical protein